MYNNHNHSRALRSFCHFPLMDDDFWESMAPYQNGLSISEDDKHVYVEAHLPGLQLDDIEVTFEKGVLWIRGEKKEESEDKKKKYHRKASSSFSYRVEIPEVVDEKKEPDATYKDGVMQVIFLKAQESPRAKKINVKPR